MGHPHLRHDEHHGAFYYSYACGAFLRVLERRRFTDCGRQSLFHTKYRALAQGFMFFIVRIGVGLISLVVPAMITGLGFKTAGAVMIAFLVIHMIIGLRMAPETRGKSLEAIQSERYHQSG